MISISKIFMLAVSLLSVISICYANSGVVLVENGNATAEIVIPEKPLSSVKFAAEDLQDNLMKISGAKLPIVTSPSQDVKNQIYVGASDYTKKLGVTIDDLKTEGFKIVVKNNYVILAGHDEQRPSDPYPKIRGATESQKIKNAEAWHNFAGDKSVSPGFTGPFNSKLGFQVSDATATLYAVSEFLEQLGVRWYNPYENGTVIPNLKTVTAAFQETRKEPKFPHRSFNYYNAMATDTEGVLWFKRLKFGRSHAYYENGHSTRNILTPEQEKNHPEYYAMKDGKRIPGMGNAGVPRLMDPDFRKASINYMNKALEAYPSLVNFTLGMPDGFTQIDERDAKVWPSVDKGYNATFSDYVWDYWLFAAKELKKSHPDKFLTCFSYTTYTEPPSQIQQLPDNVALFMCYGVAFSMLPEYKYYKDVREKWLKMLTSKKLFIYEYCLFYRKSAPTCPVVFTKIMQEEMQKLNGICEGKDIEIMPWKKNNTTQIAYPGLTHMIHYLQGKLYWDPDLDLKKLLKEYYELYFGPAKDEMKEFYEFSEEVWTRPESRSVTKTSGFLKENDVNRYFDILKRAREKTEKDSVYDKRIAQIEAEMEPLKKLFSNLERTGPEFRCYPIDEKIDVIDGNLDKSFWNKYTRQWYTMSELVTGKPVPKQNSTNVTFRITPDKSMLIIGVKCFEPNMDKVTAKATIHDDMQIFNDDLIEIYIETPQRSFFKIAVNSNGTIFDQSNDSTIVERDTLPILWNPGIKAAVKKEKDYWSAEIAIPTDDFGTLGPNKPYPWGINVCRTRLAGGKAEAYALSPTGVMQFGVLTKLGNLYLK